ncbi:GNAT family N-acetyltransferase [Demequina mangrovi]|uniref:Putative acetyltransferase n=1 Tax=Demequina mangrovi TaxID=1043493 RepID=A0A1H7ANJ2_9MICO|nr:GNAT family N-acetyltransferase [Demequina mangrovi]SEJ63642.1 putative acetyltransferase [Demequina mangrovi]
MQISPADPTTPDILALLNEHLAEMHATSPAESVHALDVEALRRPEVTFLAARDQSGDLLGVGAVVALADDHAEIKSMRTTAQARGKGVAAAVLAELVATAQQHGRTRVSLETGTEPHFAPARRLYERHGFLECEPFGKYTLDPNSIFYTREV